jgi:hypothetical protein
MTTRPAIFKSAASQVERDCQVRNRSHLDLHAATLAVGRAATDSLLGPLVSSLLAFRWAMSKSCWRSVV